MPTIPPHKHVETLAVRAPVSSPALNCDSRTGEATVAVLGLVVILALLIAVATTMLAVIVGWEGLWLAVASPVAVAAALRYHIGRSASTLVLLRLTAATVLIGGSVLLAAGLLVGISSAFHSLVDRTQYASVHLGEA